MISKPFFLIVSFLFALFLYLSCDDKPVEPLQPVLSVDRSTIDFGIDQLALQLLINNNGESTLEWNIENAPQAWYEFSPASGAILAETDTVAVIVDRAGLSGDFADTLTITSNGGTAQVEILMQVPTSPTLSVYPMSLDFSVDEDMASFQIINSGPGLLEWSITENIDWLELSPDSGAAGNEIDTIMVSIQRPNLSNDNLSGDILIYSNGGSQTISISARDTLYEDAGIFTFLILERTISPSHMGNPRDDLISARFDSAYSPCEPANSLAPDSIYCNEYELLWNIDKENFEYDQAMPRTFLALGENYIFSVNGNSNVPSLTDSIAFPLQAPYLTSPADSAIVSRNSDLILEWSDTGGNQVAVSLILFSDSLCAIPYDTVGLHGINTNTDNDGQHIFLSAQLSQLDPGEYRLVLANYNAHGITAGGYHPDSFIMAKTISYVTIYLQ